MARTATTELVRSFEVPTARVVLFLYHLRELLQDVAIDLENVVDKLGAVREAHGQEERSRRSVAADAIGTSDLRHRTDRLLAYARIRRFLLASGVALHGINDGSIDDGARRAGSKWRLLPPPFAATSSAAAAD